MQGIAEIESKRRQNREKEYRWGLLYSPHDLFEEREKMEKTKMSKKKKIVIGILIAAVVILLLLFLRCCNCVECVEAGEPFGFWDANGDLWMGLDMPMPQRVSFPIPAGVTRNYP